MKGFFTLLLCFSLFFAQSQTLAKWDFETSTGAPSITPINGTASSVTVGTGQTISFFTGYNSTKAISTTGFPSTSTPDLSKYFEFTITPNNGFIVNISEISFFAQHSATGASGWVLRSSIDNYSANLGSGSIPLTFAAPALTTGSLSGNVNLQGVTTPIIFRLYGVSASGTSGTMRVDDLTINGAIATASNTPLISISTTNLTTFSTNIGTPSPTQNFNVTGFNLTNDIIITAPAGFEISLSNNTGFNPSLTLQQITGSVTQTPIYVRLTGISEGSFSGNIRHISSGATTKDVSVTGSVNAIVPTISLSTSSLNTFVTTEGSPSISQNFTVSGSNLTDNITINAPSGFEISISNSNFSSSLTLTQTGGTIATTNIYCRLIGTTQGSYSGNIRHISTGATTKDVSVTGTVNPFFNGQNYIHLRGNWHAHTSYSDGNKDAATSGVSTPAGSFSYARLSNNMDYLGISEHNHVSAGMSLVNYALGVQQAAVETTPTFSAIYGIEYGVISNGGHMLVYGFDKLIGWDAGQYDIFNSEYDYASLYNTINARQGAWASLAHPQTGDYSNLFGSQAFSMSADSAISGCAIRSGSAFSTTTNYTDSPATLYELEFKMMLAKGYHVAPLIDHDNHYTTFGRTVKGRTVVLAESNTPTKILEAVKARRVYASDDWNEKIDFTINGLNIGSIGNIQGSSNISISVSDPDNENVNNIELWYGVPSSNTNATLLTSRSNTNTLTYTHNTVINSKYYYYVKVFQQDGDLLWTAPIWTTKTSDIVPIELIDFKAQLQEKDKSVFITWDAIQTNTADYIIERSKDGNSFEGIGKVKGSNKGGAYHYAFTDLEPIEGYSYYRLKQIDENGIVKYSNIASIYFKPLILKLKSLSPNPTTDFVNVVFDSEKSSSDLAYFVYDAEGRAVLYQKISRVTEGENSVNIDVSKLPIGLFFLNIGKRDDRMIQTKFIKN